MNRRPRLPVFRGEKGGVAVPERCAGSGADVEGTDSTTRILFHVCPKCGRTIGVFRTGRLATHQTRRLTWKEQLVRLCS